jgi:hypothetical protein
MIIELNIKNTENIGEVTAEDLAKFTEIVEALVSTGSLTGIRNGQTILHFDAEGTFMGVNVNYFPWRRKKSLTKSN